MNKGFDIKNFHRVPETPKSYFVPINTRLIHRFFNFVCITSFFNHPPRSGIMAGKDHLVMDVDKGILLDNIYYFFNHNYEILSKRKIKINDTKSWQKNAVFSNTTYAECSQKIQKIRYRGFDYKFICYDRSILEGHRMGYLDQISNENPCIIVSKSSRKPKFSTVFSSNGLYEKCFLSVTDTSYAFLLKYNGKNNINTTYVPFEVDAKELFHYIYAILFSATYRKRYDPYLRKNFPRIPIPKNKDLFQRMSFLGNQLINFHLLNIEIESIFNPKSIEKNWIVNEILFSKKENRLYFDNPERNQNSPFIDHITPEMWEFEIGSIPQLQQFLSSRKFSSDYKWNSLQRGLNLEELTYFLKMCTAIKKTIEILPKIDEIYNLIDVIEKL